MWYVLNQLSFPTQAKIAIRKETRPIINIVEDDVRLALEDIFTNQDWGERPVSRPDADEHGHQNSRSDRLKLRAKVPISFIDRLI